MAATHRSVSTRLPPAGLVLAAFACLMVAAEVAAGQQSGEPLFVGHFYPFDQPGSYPAQSVAADLNADGLADLLFATDDSSLQFVAIMLANGMGGLEDAAFVHTGIGRIAGVAVGHLDGDAHIDIIAVSRRWNNNYEGHLVLLHGNGDGTFGSPVLIETGIDAKCVTVADFNADGYADVVIGGADSNVWVTLNNADGSFAAPVPFAIGDDPSQLVAGHFDSDGVHDVIAVGGFRAVVLGGDAEGVLRLVSEIDPSGPINSVAVEFFNNDGQADIALAVNPGSAGRVIAYLGDGSGQFDIAWQADFASALGALLAADVDTDGVVDIAAHAAETGNPGVAVFSGVGDGTFRSPLFTPAASFASAAFSDLDADHDPDLVVTGSAAHLSGAGVLYNDGSGRFESYLPVPATLDPGRWSKVSTGNFNGDAHQDLCAIGSRGEFKVLLGNGDSTYSEAWSISLPQFLYSGAVGDFDGDGELDVFVVSSSFSGCPVLLGRGDGTFVDAGRVLLPAGSPVTRTRALSSDLDDDGDDDVLFVYVPQGESRRRLARLLSNGDGTFADAHFFSLNGSINDFALADFDGDGVEDIVVGANPGSGNDRVGWGLLKGNGDGSFDPWTLDESGCSSVAAAQLVGSSHPDLVLSSASGVLILMGNGNGSFEHFDAMTVPQDNSPSFNIARDIELADYNGDEVGDISAIIEGRLLLWLSDGGAFADQFQFYLGPIGSGVGDHTPILGDVDSLPDIAAHEGLFTPTSPIVILRNLSRPLCRVDLTNIGGINLDDEEYAIRANPTCLGDVNQDGVVNFADVNLVLSSFNQSGACILGDTNGDGVTDFADLNNVLSFFNVTCS